MTDKTYTTKSGKTLTDADIEQLADEAATTDYDERRDWIVANWPYVVELEQLNALIAAQPALAH